MLQRYKINVTVLYFYTEKNQKNALHSLSHVLQDYNLIYFIESSRLYWRTLFPPLKR